MGSDFYISQSENEIFFYRRMQAQFEVLGILGIEDFNFPKKTDQNKLISNHTFEKFDYITAGREEMYLCEGSQSCWLILLKLALLRF